MLVQVVKEFTGRAGTVGELQLVQMAQLDEAAEARGREEWAAGQREDLQNLKHFKLKKSISFDSCHLQMTHAAQMLQPKIADLCAPAHKQCGQREHRAHVSHANVSDVNASVKKNI